MATITRRDPGYTTVAREVTDITVVAEREHARRGVRAGSSWGDVEVSHQVVSYLKRSQPSGEVVGEEPLDLPGPLAHHHRRVVDRARRRARRRRARRASTCPAPPTPPSTARSGCCRSSPPATAGTSAASRPPATPTPACSRCSCTTASPAVRASPSAASGPHGEWLGGHPGDHRGLRVRPRLPLVRAVAQVRQPEQPARQGRGAAPARRPARATPTPTRSRLPACCCWVWSSSPSAPC